MIVPNLNEPHLQGFCEEVSPDHVPIYVPLQPMPGAPYRCCFDIVDICIGIAKGSKLMGWAIWEWPGVFIEAELHCVWKAPDGKLIDPTPQQFHTEARNLFLPDPDQPEPQTAIDNRRKALNNDPITLKMIRAFELRHKRRFPVAMWHTMQATYYEILNWKKYGSRFLP